MSDVLATETELRDEFARISFGWPGMNVTLVQSFGWREEGIFHVRVTMKVKDARRPAVIGVDYLQKVGMVWEIRLPMRRDLLVHNVRQAIIQLLAHEVDEWLRYDGELVRDPHARRP